MKPFFVKFVESLIALFLLLLTSSAWATFTVSPSDADACICSGSVTYTPLSSTPFSYQLFDLDDMPIQSGQNQSNAITLNNLCPSVYHLVITYTNGTIEDDYFEVSAGAVSTGDAHKVIVCRENYLSGSSPIPFDLTPELSSFLPGGTWYTPNGLIIAPGDLNSLTASTLRSGWYTYVSLVGSCEVVSGVYIQSNNIGLTTTYLVCETAVPFQMVDFMQGAPDTIGQWFDVNLNIVPGGIYDPATMASANYTYVISNLPGCVPAIRVMFVDEKVQRSPGTSGSVMVCSGSSPFNMLNQLGGNPDDGGMWSGPNGDITPIGSDIFNPNPIINPSGDYTYTISSSAPCLSPQTSTLTVTYTNDNPSGLSANVQLCSTTASLDMLNALNGNPVAGGTWTAPNGQVVTGDFSPATQPAGNYEYYYPNVGCSPSSSVLGISVEAPVNAGSNGSETICLTDNSFLLSSMLSSNATSGGTWYYNNAAIPNNFIAPAAGNYTILYRVEAQVCPDDQASFTVNVQPSVAEPIDQTIYLCSLGSQVDLRSYFPNLTNVFFQTSSNVLVSDFFDPAIQNSTVLEVVNPSGNTCPDQGGQLIIEVLYPVIDDATVPREVCRSALLFNLNTTLPPAAIGMGTWLDVNDNPVSNMVSIDFLGTESYVYEVIQPITCGGEHLQIDLITFTPNDAGSDASEVYCYTDSPDLLSDLLPVSQAGAGSWFYNNAPFNATVFNPATNSSGNYIYRIPANGPCPADEAVLSVTVQQGINYSAGSDVHVCAGSLDQFIGSSPASGAVYSWTPTAGISNASSSQPLVSIPNVVNQTSTTVYTVFADDGVCTFTDYVSVIVEPNPVINLDESYDICFGESLTLTDAVSTSCNWSPYNLFNDPTSGSPTFESAASVQIHVDAVSDFGCTTSANSQINVNPLPILIAQHTPVSGCKPVNLYIEPGSQSQNINQIVWNVAGVGTFVGDSLELSLMVPGVYDVAATAISEYGCVSNLFLEEVAEVYPSPVAQFTISPGELSTLAPEAEFTNHSVGSILYEWTFSGLGESAEENPVFTFPNERSENFYVCLDAANNYGCRDTSCRSIYMDAEYAVFAPGAFTPDGDGDNDAWKPLVRGFDTSIYELSIFNRWGDRVFFTNNPDEPWTGGVMDGGFFGQNEVYNWRLKLRVDYSADELYFDGSIVLIR